MDLTAMFLNLDWLEIMAAAFSAFVVGGIWYGPVLFI